MYKISYLDYCLMIHIAITILKYVHFRKSDVKNEISSADKFGSHDSAKFCTSPARLLIKTRKCVGHNLILNNKDSKKI